MGPSRAAPDASSVEPRKSRRVTGVCIKTFYHRNQPIHAMDVTLVGGVCGESRTTIGSDARSLGYWCWFEEPAFGVSFLITNSCRIFAAPPAATVMAKFSNVKPTPRSFAG